MPARPMQQTQSSSPGGEEACLLRDRAGGRGVCQEAHCRRVPAPDHRELEDRGGHRRSCGWTPEKSQRVPAMPIASSGAAERDHPHVREHVRSERRPVLRRAAARPRSATSRPRPADEGDRPHDRQSMNEQDRQGGVEHRDEAEARQQQRREALEAPPVIGASARRAADPPRRSPIAARRGGRRPRWRRERARSRRPRPTRSASKPIGKVSRLAQSTAAAT